MNDNRRYNDRREESTNKPESLADQLKKLNRPPEQKLRELPVHEWSKDLYDYATNHKTSSCTAKLVQFVTSKYKSEMLEYHKNGTSLKEITTFIRSKSDELRY